MRYVNCDYYLCKDDYTRSTYESAFCSQGKQVVKALLARCPLIEASIERLYLYIGPNLMHPRTEKSLFSEVLTLSAVESLDSTEDLTRDEFFQKFINVLSTHLFMVLEITVVVRNKSKSNMEWDFFEESMLSFLSKVKPTLKIAVSNAKDTFSFPEEAQVMMRHLIMSKIVSRNQLMAFGVPQAEQKRVYTFKEAFNG